MNHKLSVEVELLFEEKFGRKPEKIVFSPGRINLIGEHVDYNDGWVMPAAIDKAIYVAIGRAADISSVYAEDIQSQISFDAAALKPSQRSWENYILGVVSGLQEKCGFRQNFNAVFSGDLPIGSGLSSSAALDCGFAFALNELFDLGLTRPDLALLAQKAEHEYVGIKSGIMDQLASLLGRSEHFLFLDTKTLAFQYFKLDMGEYRLQLYNSNVQHELANSAYNHRRAQCETVVKELQKIHPEIDSLRDCTHEMLFAIKEHVEKDDYTKAKFVIDEILRVNAAAEAIKAGDIEAVGQLLNETHIGLRDEYEVSCDEVDFIQSFTLAQEGVIGSRLMGGGFGGCTINLIHKDSVERVTQEITKAYKHRYDIELNAISVNLTHGTKCIN